MPGRKLEHVGVMVSNIDASIDFYERVVGLKLKDRMRHTNGVIELAFLGFDAEGESEVELIQGYTGHLTDEGKVHHIAFTVDDIEHEFARIQVLGDVRMIGRARMIDSEITTLPNGSRYFFFQGPDGERIEFFQSTR